MVPCCRTGFHAQARLFCQHLAKGQMGRGCGRPSLELATTKRVPGERFLSILCFRLLPVLNVSDKLCVSVCVSLHVLAYRHRPASHSGGFYGLTDFLFNVSVFVTFCDLRKSGCVFCGFGEHLQAATEPMLLATETRHMGAH